MFVQIINKKLQTQWYLDFTLSDFIISDHETKYYNTIFYRLLQQEKTEHTATKSNKNLVFGPYFFTGYYSKKN